MNLKRSDVIQSVEDFSWDHVLGPWFDKDCPECKGPIMRSSPMIQVMIKNGDDWEGLVFHTSCFAELLNQP